MHARRGAGQHISTTIQPPHTAAHLGRLRQLRPSQWVGGVLLCRLQHLLHSHQAEAESQTCQRKREYPLQGWGCSKHPAPTPAQHQPPGQDNPLGRWHSRLGLSPALAAPGPQPHGHSPPPSRPPPHRPPRPAPRRCARGRKRQRQQRHAQCARLRAAAPLSPPFAFWGGWGPAAAGFLWRSGGGAAPRDSLYFVGDAAPASVLPHTWHFKIGLAPSSLRSQPPYSWPGRSGQAAGSRSWRSGCPCMGWEQTPHRTSGWQCLTSSQPTGARSYRSPTANTWHWRQAA